MLSREKAQREGEQFVFTRIANVFVGDRERERERHALGDRICNTAAVAARFLTECTGV